VSSSMNQGTTSQNMAPLLHLGANNANRPQQFHRITNYTSQNYGLFADSSTKNFRPSPVPPRRASDEVSVSLSHRAANLERNNTGRRSKSVINVGESDTSGVKGRPQAATSRFDLLKRQRSSLEKRDSPKHELSTNETKNVVPLNSGENRDRKKLDDNKPDYLVNAPSLKPSPLVDFYLTGCRRESEKSQPKVSSETSTGKGSTQKVDPFCAPANDRPKETQLGSTLSSEAKNTEPADDSRCLAAKQAELARRVSVSAFAYEQSPNSGHSSARCGQLQRKGSFAMQTLRKLRKTVSLSKASNGDVQSAARQDASRASPSSSSYHSDEDSDAIGQDLAAVHYSRPGK